MCGEERSVNQNSQGIAVPTVVLWTGTVWLLPTPPRAFESYSASASPVNETLGCKAIRHSTTELVQSQTEFAQDEAAKLSLGKPNNVPR